MPAWLSPVVQGAVIAAVTAVAVGLYRGWRARRLRRRVQAGKPVTFESFLRANIAPFPRRWRSGWISVGIGAPTWKPRFSLLRRPVALPMSAEVYTIRRVAGVAETFTIDSACRIVSARTGDLTLDLAILERELETALRALASGTGGGWRIPITLEVEAAYPRNAVSRPGAW